MTGPPLYLDAAAVAKRLGVDRKTIYHYVYRHLMPAPDVYLGRSPGWLPTTIDAYRAELAQRRGEVASVDTPETLGVDTSELDRMAEVLERSQAIGAFLDWLTDVKRWHLAAWVTELEYEPGERYEVIEAPPWRGRPGFRVRDRVSLLPLSTRWDTREAAEQDAAERDAAYQREARKPEYRRLRVQGYSIEALLAEYFGIDLDKIETERRALLDALRQANEQRQERAG